jgi:pilus assembly protein Flp/PilA
MDYPTQGAGVAAAAIMRAIRCLLQFRAGNGPILVVILDNPFYDYRTRSLLNEEKAMEMIKRFFKEEDGATLVEYAILVALIAVAVIATVVLLGGAIRDAFQSVVVELNNAGS